MTTYECELGVIELHDDWLVVRLEGKSAEMLGLAGSREIPLAALTGAGLKPAKGIRTGYIHLHVAGEPSRDDRFDPNKVTFTLRQSAGCKELADLLKRRVAADADRPTREITELRPRPDQRRLNPPASKTVTCGERLGRESVSWRKRPVDPGPGATGGRGPRASGLGRARDAGMRNSAAETSYGSGRCD